MSEITQDKMEVDVATPVSREDTPNSLSDKENVISKQQEKLDKKLQREKQKELEKKLKDEERLAKKRQLDQERSEKKRKIEEERDAKRQRIEEEKELKRKKLEEEKELKRKKLEEEKLLREEKKLQEKLAKQERLEKKEQERKLKEIERKRLEDEKKRAEELKQRSQMKISSFFQVKPVKNQENKSSETPAETVATTASPGEDITTSKYDSDFLPFFIQKNVTMKSRPVTIFDTQELDDIISNRNSSTTPEFTNYLKSFTSNSVLPSKQTTPDEIITALNSSTTTESQVYQLISQLPPIKYISFYENEKPPYIGTWCSSKHQTHQGSIIDNPINSEITGLDYDYDSDLEWNKDDQEEGEDLDLEDEEEEEDETMLVSDDDDDEFVENDGVRKKKFISLSVITRWNNEENKALFDDFQVVVMGLENQEPIDPLYNYWAGEEQREETGEQTSIEQTTPSKINGTNNILTPQKKTIQDGIILKDLIQFIEKNNDFTIGTLVELSKKEFKQFTKGLLKSTIQDIACYNKKSSIWEDLNDQETRTKQAKSKLSSFKHDSDIKPISTTIKKQTPKPRKKKPTNKKNVSLNAHVRHQACSQPSTQLSNDEIKWLYELDDEQMVGDSSCMEEEGQEIGQFVFNLHVDEKEDKSDTISDSESEPEIISEYRIEVPESIYEPHQRSFDPATTFQSFQFAKQTGVVEVIESDDNVSVKSPEKIRGDILFQYYKYRRVQ
ncbi:Chromatin assembly factor 1 subunit rlf2 [Spathaspora sp. JA1]|nr:Chromatin assembly factor 1 subunit rlf2 [Spathaspora sp. JA1]